MAAQTAEQGGERKRQNPEFQNKSVAPPSFLISRPPPRPTPTHSTIPLPVFSWLMATSLLLVAALLGAATGLRWTQITESAPWKPRFEHVVTVDEVRQRRPQAWIRPADRAPSQVTGDLVLIGGLATNFPGFSRVADVWMSPNSGTSWEEAISEAPWLGRVGFGSASLAVRTHALTWFSRR